MNFRAESKVTPFNLVKFQNFVVPRLVAAVTESAEVVTEEAKTIVPVDTGELRDSIAPGPVELVGTTVRGSVDATAGHAAFVEYGTGQRGQASPGAGPGPYNPSWPGMAAQPYMRPAVDIGRPEIIAAFTRQGFVVK